MVGKKRDTISFDVQQEKKRDFCFLHKKIIAHAPDFNNFSVEMIARRTLHNKKFSKYRRERSVAMEKAGNR